ncbi:MAG: hypothetical protein ACI9UN_004780 [Granulosicoccus sp.]
MNVFVTNENSEILSSTAITINRDRLLGHMALVANPGNTGTGHWFNELKGSGDMLTVYPEREFGPTLFASYTISRKVLTVNAQLPPLCLDAWHDLRLEVQTMEFAWITLVVGTINPLSWTSRMQVTTDSLADYQAIRIAVDESIGAETILHTAL